MIDDAGTCHARRGHGRRAGGAAPSARPFDIPTPVRGTVSSTSVLPAVDSSRFVVVNVSSCCAVRAIGRQVSLFLPPRPRRAGDRLYELKRLLSITNRNPLRPVDGRDTFGNIWYHDGPFFSSRRWQVVFLTRRAPTRASPPLHLPMLDALG